MLHRFSYSKILRRLFPAITICLGLFIAVFLCEIALRLIVRFELLGKDSEFTIFMNKAENLPARNPLMYRRSKDPEIMYEFVPNSRRRHIQINSDGFRGREYTWKVPEKIERIIVLGDSETFGALLKDEETLPGALEKKLNGLQGEKTYEVLNLGLPGYNTRQQFRILQTKAIQYNPSIVILYYVFNDPIIGDQTIFLGNARFSWSYLSTFATWAIKQQQSKSGTLDLYKQSKNIIEFYQALYSSEYFESCKNIIREMADYLKKRNISFILLIAPEIYGYNDFSNYPYKNIHDKLHELSAEDMIHVIDPLDRLVSTGKKPKDFWVIPTDCHKNREANGIIAGTVARSIISKVYNSE